MNSSFNTLISAQDLLKRVDQPDIRIFDCRYSLKSPTTGLHAYERGHISGAMFADMNQDLSARPVSGVTGRHPLPTRAKWINKVLNWGLHPDIQVVVYDDVGGANAARLWWMLQWLGHEKVAVLDGGLQAWEEANGKLVRVLPKPFPRSNDLYTDRAPLTKLLTTEEINGDLHLLVDARELARFKGEVEPFDPVAGHIPGALCLPYSTNLDEDGKFKSPQELQEKFTVLAKTHLTPVCYCGSGVTACHNILAATYAGMEMPALYAGSWSEWIVDSARPIARGA